MVPMMRTEAIMAISVSINTHAAENRQPRVVSTPTANVPKIKLHPRSMRLVVKALKPHKSHCVCARVWSFLKLRSLAPKD